MDADEREWCGWGCLVLLGQFVIKVDKRVSAVG